MAAGTEPLVTGWKSTWSLTPILAHFILPLCLEEILKLSFRTLWKVESLMLEKHLMKFLDLPGEVQRGLMDDKIFSGSLGVLDSMLWSLSSLDKD